MSGPAHAHRAPMGDLPAPHGSSQPGPDLNVRPDGPSQVEGANYYATRRHYGTAWRAEPSGGHASTSLCSTTANPVTLYDQVFHDCLEARYGSKAVIVRDLPLCKKCQRKAAKP